jgi:cation diffusion facilitator family transporter
MMLHKALVWLGFSEQRHDHPHGHGDHGHGHDTHASDHGHNHTHGVVDPVIATTEHGIWAVKWSFVILGVTAALQLGIVVLSGSVALLADTIHNVGDAATAVPLWIAFLFARRRASARFTYGFGRVEDLAGVSVVLIIVCSAIVAGYEAINRLLHPQPIAFLGWVAAAGIVGFVGNEWVAVFRIRVGRDIDSVALIADGYHARTDGLTSLAVVLGALGVWLGFPAADPLIGLVITAMIFGIVWQSTKAVFTRLLDGVDPAVIEEIKHAVQHTPEVQEVTQVRVRWLGHRLHAELNIAVSPHLSVAQGHAIATEVRHQLLHHLPHLANATIHIDPLDASGEEHHRIEEHAHGDLPAHAHP